MAPRQATVSASPPAPREAQRRRTRRAVVEAAQRLLAEGRSRPTVDDIAAEADVSRRTVYQYFPTLDQLLLDAAIGSLVNSEIDAALDAGRVTDDARDRVDVLVRAVLGQAATTLPFGRQIIRLTVDAPEIGGARRGYRRVEWLERALEPLRPRLSAEQFERLVSALAIVVGWEAMTVLRDVRGLDTDTELEVTVWAARALVDAMSAEVGFGAGHDAP